MNEELKEELEEILNKGKIKFICINNRYTLFNKTGLPILNFEKEQGGWYIRPVNLQVNDKDVDYLYDRMQYAYHDDHSVDHIHGIYYWLAKEFEPLEPQPKEEEEE